MEYSRPDNVAAEARYDRLRRAPVFQKALHDQGIPFTAFAVDDIQKEYERLTKLGAVFRGEPKKVGPTTAAVFDDTCGNFIQIYQA